MLARKLKHLVAATALWVAVPAVVAADAVLWVRGETSALEQIALVAGVIAKMPNGKYPTSLADLHEYDIEQFVKAGAGTPSGAVGDRYGFPDGELILPGKGRVLVMATRPLFGTPDEGYGYGKGYNTVVPLAYLGSADAQSHILLLSEPAAAALLAANHGVNLLTMGTKVVPPPWRPLVLNEDDKKLQQLFIDGKIHITTQAELAAMHPELHLTVPPASEAARPTLPSAAKLASTSSPNSISPVKWLVAAVAAAVLAFGLRSLRRK
jgi:hypothetical protein